MSTGVLDPGRPAGRQLQDTVQHGLHDARGVRRALRTSSEHGAAHLGLAPPRTLRILWEALLLPVFGGGCRTQSLRTVELLSSRVYSVSSVGWVKDRSGSAGTNCPRAAMKASSEMASAGGSESIEFPPRATMHAS